MHSTSLPLGIQADGLPRMCPTKTIAKRGHCTAVFSAMQNLFLKMIAAWWCLVVTIISLYNELKLRKNIKCQNENATKKSHLMQAIAKRCNFCRNFEVFENLRKISNGWWGGAPALRVFRAGTRLTVHHALAYLVEQRSSCLKSNTELRWNCLSLDPRRSVMLVVRLMFLMMFCLMSYWFVTFRCFIS